MHLKNILRNTFKMNLGLETHRSYYWNDQKFGKKTFLGGKSTTEQP